VGPLLEVGGAMYTLPDPRAVVRRRGAGALEASWPDGLRARLRTRAEGRGYRVDCSVSSERAVRVGAVGVRVLGLAATRMLVDGYHSWDWAGVREASAGYGWWGGVWGTPGGAQTAVALHSPPRLGPLLLRWNHGASVGAMTVGAPPQLRHATGDPPLLGLEPAAGATLHGDPIRIAPLDTRSPWGVGLPRLRPDDRRPASRLAGWMSWNCLGPGARAADVVAAAGALAPPGGLVLLDDGWMQLWGDWTERGDFDGTLPALADAVHAAGRRLGVWLAPFLVDPASRAAVEHGALLLRDEGGALVESLRAPRPQYVLDASTARARAHLAALGRRMGGMGVDALKLDFLFAGALPGVRAKPRSSPSPLSDVASLRAGVAALADAYRATAPRGARILACGAPATPLVGLVDACRSGEDSVLNVPPAHVPPPPRPWFLHGDAVVRAQARNLGARAWLWGATVPPDVDAVTLGQVGDTPPPDDSSVRRWLQLAVRCGGPLLDADVPDGRLDPRRSRLLRRTQDEVQGTTPRPQRTPEPLSGSAVDADATPFLDWPTQLPDGYED
jgi:hypothetical protein